MRAARIDRFGGLEVIEVRESEPPEPGADEVLVRVAAAGVGPWDGWIRAGKSVLPQPLPLTLGSDLSGTILAVGSRVANLRVGEDVFGVTNPRFVGAQAELAVASASMVAKRPSGLTDVQAASMPVVAVTALQMLFDHGKLAPGQRVLIHGGSGSVGGYAVQLARRAGAHVIATETTSARRESLDLGAHELLTLDALDRVEQVDLVIDTVGGDAQTRSLALLRHGGTLVSSVSAPDAEAAARLRVSAQFMLVDVTTRALQQLAQWWEQGSLVTRVGAVLPLAEVRRAHEMLEGLTPRPAGKIVLTVA